MVTQASGNLNQFLHKGRLRLNFEESELSRAVYQADLVRVSSDATLEEYVSDRAPFLYKDPRWIAEQFSDGYFFSAIKDVLRRFPTAQSFRESHFGEILGALYGEEILGLRRLYSKLALGTAENANAYKMDLLFYRAGTGPVEFVFGEVKSSMKTASEGLPANHDKSCFASLFSSFNDYRESDLKFDLSVIQERLSNLPQDDQERIRKSLLPHRPKLVKYAGFCVIDSSTFDTRESSVLATRRNDKAFDVDLLCVAELPDVVSRVYEKVDAHR